MTATLGTLAEPGGAPTARVPSGVAHPRSVGRDHPLPSHSTVGDYLELVRAPAVLTVLGDTLAGSAAAGHPWTVRRALLPLASAGLYSGGMALNDWADRELDATERPERPIPSGRITPRRALIVAGGLGAAGLALAALGGGARSLTVAAPLAVGVWLYDAVLKETPAGPVAMAACRGLDVLMGAGLGQLRPATPTALALAAHTAGVTWLSRGEVHGTTAGVARGTLAATAAVLAATVVPARRPDPAASPRPWAFGATLVTAAGYAATVLPAQVAAVREPSAARARAATGAGIRAMIPLQAARSARSGSPVSAAVIGVIGLAAAVLRRRPRAVSET
ncbi:SCO3242 family prenyltransferase [Cellulomonas sp. NPDC089187]|uniref:SCO3242 family prenyltransferase n=1 Tax=Cellulomonas sp. NPDC089187 TaxID=3154970 RepID=UPI0034190ECD